MNIWLVLWVILAVSLAIFMAWTFWILINQKRAWKAYAAKRKLRYKSLALMGGPELNGVIGDHTVGVFTSEHVSQDARGVRKLTAIEVNLNSSMPVSGGIASAGMIPILKGLSFKQEYLPKHVSWNKAYVASTNNRNVLQKYLTDARVEALCQLMEIPNSWVILIFKDDVMLLRMDIADPLHDPKRLDQRVKSMLKAAEILELSKGESTILKSEEVKSAAKDVALEIDDELIGEPLNLVLEDDVRDEAVVDVPDGVIEDAVKDAPVSDNKKKAKGSKPSASSKTVKKK